MVGKATLAAVRSRRMGLVYKWHASMDEPKYIIKSDNTNRLAIHKGSALKKIRKGNR